MVATADSWLDRRSAFWLVAGLIALIFATTNLPWNLDDYDQAKQAFTSFEMVQQSHWFYQHTPNERIATKPPLVGWISAGCYALTRSWEFAWRVPSAAAAVLLLVLLGRNASAAYGPAAGLLALGAFGLNLLSPRLATLVRTDMPLAFVVFAIGVQIWRKVRSGDRWSARDQVIAFALLTAGMLIKGPIIYAFLLPGIVIVEWRSRQRGQRANAWSGWRPWMGSLAIFVAWAIGGMLLVPGFYEQVVLREFAGRFTETIHRPQPFYFYLPHLLHKFAPWSILALAIAVARWRCARQSLKESWRRVSPETLWLLSWSLGGLLVMSLVPSKRVDRIFPIIPPLCLLIAAQFSSARKVLPAVTRWGGVALVFAVLFTAGYTVFKISGGYRTDAGALARFGESVRAQTVTNGWRYEVIGGPEEGLLLYLQRTRFVKPAEAVERWNSGALDALVVPEEERDALTSALVDAVPTGLEGAIAVNNRPRRYLLLHRP